MSNVPHSKRALRMFSAMQQTDHMTTAETTKFNPLTWMCFSGRGKAGRAALPVHKVVLTHGTVQGVEAAHEISHNAERTLLFPSAPELTCLQSLEIKTRSLVMGDLTHFFGEVVNAGLMTIPATGLVCTVTNPYYVVTIEHVRAAELFDKTLGVLRTIPSVWKESPIEHYAVRCSIDEMGMSIGVAVLDEPWIPLFDVSGALA